MVSKTEEEYLVLEKTNEGKSIEQAYKEIKLLKASQIQFTKLKQDFKVLNKKLVNKDKDIEKLRQTNFKILSIPRQETKMKEIKESKQDIEVLKALDRIFCLMNAEKRIGLADLEKTARVKSDICKKIISLLIRNNLVKEVKETNNRYNTLYLERI
jgi:hypothetical protein